MSEDKQKNDDKKARGSRRRRRGCIYPLMGVTVLLCGVLFAVMPSAEEMDATETAAAAQGTQAAGTAVAQATIETWTPSPEPSATDTPTATPLPTSTAGQSEQDLQAAAETVKAVMAASSTPLATIVPPAAQSGQDLEAAADTVKLLMAAVAPEVTIGEVRIADGTANGGDVTVFVTLLDTGGDKLYSDLGAVMGGVTSALPAVEVEADGIVVVIGDRSENAVGMVTASVGDVQAYMDGEITLAQFVELLNIENLTGASSQGTIAVPTPRARRPGNCEQARAWGMDAVQAGAWDHLDRDGDGVACYGD